MPRSFIGHKGTFASLGATVINDIAVETVFFSAWSAAIVCISKYRTNLGINSQMLTVLGTVLGLVVSFRTTSAYDRWWEGRKLWTLLQLNSRNIAQIIWVQIPSVRKPKTGGPIPPDSELKATIEKKTMINLVQAFSVAVKHYLRGEGGIFYDDLYPLVSFLPKHAPKIPHGFRSGDDVLPLWYADDETIKNTTSGAGRSRSVSPEREGDSHSISTDQDNRETDPEKLGGSSGTGPNVPSGVKLLPARTPPKTTVYDYIPALLIVKPIISLILNRFRPARERSGRDWLGRKHKRDLPVESNVPLEITLFLSSYLAHVMDHGLIAAPIGAAFQTGLNSFQDSLTALERVRSTPLPFAYQFHLRMSVWLYLLFLPFQVLTVLNWVTIPGTAFASFLFLGFLEIAAQIEDPFGYDSNDLDIDDFCDKIAKDLSEITAHPVLDPTDYIFGEYNQPFVPGDNRTAAVIIANQEHAYHHPENGMHSVRRTLLKSWREVNDVKSSHRHHSHKKAKRI